MDSTATYTLDFAGNFAAGAQVATGAAQALAAQMQQLQAAVSGGAAAIGGAGGAASKALGGAGAAAKATGAAASGAGVNMRALGGVLRETGGGAGAMAGSAVRLVAQLGRLGNPAVIAAVAVVALSLACIAGAVAFAAYAIHAADAARTSALFAEAATGSAAGGAALESQVSRLSNSTALSTTKLQELGLGLARSGLQGQNLANAFDAAAIAASAMGDAAGGKLSGIAEEATKAHALVLNAAKLQGTGVGLDDVAAALATKLHVSLGATKAALQDGSVQVGAGLDALKTAVESKLGGIAAKQAIGLTAQLGRLGSNFASLFSGINVEPFLAALSGVTGLLDQNTVSGKALKTIATTMLQPLIDGAANALPYVKDLFQQAIILALRATIVILTAKNAIRDLGKDSGMERWSVAFKVFEVVAYAAAVPVVMLGSALAAVTLFGAGAAAAIAAPFMLLGYALYAAYDAVMSIGSAVVAYFKGIDLGPVGQSIVDGLVSGITSGASAVVGAVTSLGTSAVAALRSVLDSHSPSQVFASIGLDTAAGYAQGVDDGAPAASRSVADMIGTPAAKGGAGGGARGGIQIENLEVNVHGVKNAEELKGGDFITTLANALERALDGAGSPAEPEPAT